MMKRLFTDAIEIYLDSGDILYLLNGGGMLEGDAGKIRIRIREDLELTRARKLFLDKEED